MHSFSSYVVIPWGWSFHLMSSSLEFFTGSFSVNGVGTVVNKDIPSAPIQLVWTNQWISVHSTITYDHPSVHYCSRILETEKHWPCLPISPGSQQWHLWHLGLMNPCRGDHTVPCRMFSNIYSLDAMELILLVMTIKDVYRGLPWWSSG